MTEYLFVGGPKHGERVAVDSDEQVHTILAVPPVQMAVENGVPILAPSVAVPVQYIRRTLSMTADGGDYSNTAYVEMSVGQDQAVALISQILITEWVRQGTFEPHPSVQADA
jgi:hypothetical protein